MIVIQKQWVGMALWTVEVSKAITETHQGVEKERKFPVLWSLYQIIYKEREVYYVGKLRWSAICSICVGVCLPCIQ